MTIQFKEREITLKQSFRTYIIFENITGKSFQSASTLADMLCFMYASILASTKTTDISFDEFLDYVDDKPEVVAEFSEWLLKSNSVIAEATNDNIENEDSTKKKTRQKRS